MEKKGAEQLLRTLGDFTSKENWDNFFKIRGNDDSFEWYAEWSELRDPLLAQLSADAPPGGAPASETSAGTPSPMQILVPGCGNSRLSEHLYDLGFKDITNIDFSKVVISDMLRRNVRARPGMRWRVMDMTAMQFMDETFDAVIDKGGLDALMEPKLGPKLGNQYLSEVKRVLKSGGRFVCLTLAESHVLSLLFSKFRFGWKISLHAIPQKQSSKPSLQTFLVVAGKESSMILHQITTSISHSSLSCDGSQARGLNEALENENNIRKEFINGSDILYSLEDLRLGAKGDLGELSPGRRIQLTLGEDGCSRFMYRAVILDSKEQSGPFSYHSGVFLVPKNRAHEWLFSSEEGQWLVVVNSKAARLIMVLLDSSHTSASMDEIQKDLSPLVKQLEPVKGGNGAQIPFMMASDGLKQRKTVYQVTSPLTGPIIVEDVTYESIDEDSRCISPSEDPIFRRLIFHRTEGLVQSEALLTKQGSLMKIGEKDWKKGKSSSKSRKKVNRRGNVLHTPLHDEVNNHLKIRHNYLASSYHNGIISGFMLISTYLETVASTGRTVKAVVIGLGAGLLPMFLHGCMPFLDIEVVELDPVVLNLAKDYFGFTEDARLKVHVADGVHFVREVVNPSVSHLNDKSRKHPSPGRNLAMDSDGKGTTNIDILIIDVDSSDSRSGMTCPAADFVEESFLSTVKESLSEKGLFVINLVSRSPAVKDMVVTRMKVVFSHLFSLQLEEDVNQVLFALPTEVCISEDSFPDAAVRFEKLLQLDHPKQSQKIIDVTKKIKCLK